MTDDSDDPRTAKGSQRRAPTGGPRAWAACVVLLVMAQAAMISIAGWQAIAVPSWIGRLPLLGRFGAGHALDDLQGHDVPPNAVMSHLSHTGLGNNLRGVLSAKMLADAMGRCAVDRDLTCQRRPDRGSRLEPAPMASPAPRRRAQAISPAGMPWG